MNSFRARAFPYGSLRVARLEEGKYEAAAAACDAQIRAAFSDSGQPPSRLLQDGMHFDECLGVVQLYGLPWEAVPPDLFLDVEDEWGCLTLEAELFYFPAAMVALLADKGRGVLLGGLLHQLRPPIFPEGVEDYEFGGPGSRCDRDLSFWRAVVSMDKEKLIAISQWVFLMHEGDYVLSEDGDFFAVDGFWQAVGVEQRSAEDEW